MALTEKQLALNASRVLERDRTAVLAYWWPEPKIAVDHLDVHGMSLPIEHCESVLEMRERLSRDLDHARILLVSVPETELGQDVLARIHGRSLRRIQRWETVAEAFHTRELDSRLYKLPWMADALLEVPATRLGAGGIAALTYERAVELCLLPILGCASDRLELEDLIAGCERAASAWKAVPPERKEVYSAFLRTRFGSIASALLGAVTAGHGHAVVAMGLACEVLYNERLQVITELRDSRIRLEAYLDSNRISEADGRQWAQAAERLLRTRPDAEQLALFQSATDLLRALGAGGHIAESELLPSAFDLRLDQLGTAIQQFLRKPEQLPLVEQAEARVRAHRLIPAGHPGREAARTALALCRREVELSPSPVIPSDVVSDYVQHGAWEDYARRVLRGVRPDTFARSVSQLLDRVATRRRAVDQRFATLLVESLGNSSVPTQTLPVELALDQLVTPVAQQIPVLMLVVDGMSWDVYYSIAETLGRQGWESRKPDNAPASLLATVPSVTEFSRTSLLCGRLARGTSANEKAAFATHRGLLKATQGGKPPVLLHKAELVSGHQLSEDAARLLADSKHRVVGAVINAVDDALSKSDQMRLTWSAEDIPLLGAILTQARLGSRAVFITSDHGHVLERESQYRAAGDWERWRTVQPPATDGEIQVGGARVHALVKTDIVVPWSETIRYGTKKNGYHGGVSRQEMLVPFGLWAPAPNVLSSLPVSLLRPPDWWDGVHAGGASPALPSAKRVDKSQAQPDLFIVGADRAWMSALLASPVMLRQRERVGRISLEDDRLMRLLQCLDQRGGRATTRQLAAAVEQPPLRMRGIVSAMQRMLNVDGCPIVTMETATSTVFLDRDSLRKQFEL